MRKSRIKRAAVYALLGRETPATVARVLRRAAIAQGWEVAVEAVDVVTGPRTGLAGWQTIVAQGEGGVFDILLAWPGDVVERTAPGFRGDIARLARAGVRVLWFGQQMRAGRVRSVRVHPRRAPGRRSR